MTSTNPRSTDAALREWFSTWGKGATLLDLAYVTGKSTATVKSALENSPHAEKRGTRWFPKP